MGFEILQLALERGTSFCVDMRRESLDEDAVVSGDLVEIVLFLFKCRDNFSQNDGFKV